MAQADGQQGGGTAVLDFSEALEPKVASKTARAATPAAAAPAAAAAPLDFTSALTAKPASTPSDLISNPTGEGLYRMGSYDFDQGQVTKPEISVPYSKVGAARDAGYNLHPDEDARYQKDSTHEGQRPGLLERADTWIREKLQPVQGEDPHKVAVGLNNTDRAALRVLYNTPGYFRDLAVAAAHLGDSQQAQQDFVDLVDPGKIPEGLYDQFRSDWAKDHHLAVSNLVGSLVGMGATAAATHGATKLTVEAASRIPSPLEPIRKTMQSMVGAGERQVKAAVASQAKEAGLAAKTTEEQNRAALTKYDSDLADANQANVNAHVKWKQSVAEVEKANALAQKATEEKNRLALLEHSQKLDDAAKQNLRNHIEFLSKQADVAQRNAEAAKAVEEHNRAELTKHQQAVAEAERANTAAHVRYLSEKAEAENQNAAARAIPDSRAGLKTYIQDQAEDLDVRTEKARHDALAEGNRQFSAIATKLNPLPADMEKIQKGLGAAMDSITGTESEPSILKSINKRYGEGDAFTYEDLQGYYSEIGKELSKQQPGDIYHAYTTMQDVIGDEMQRIADSKGLGKELTAARDWWRRMAQAYYPSSDSAFSRAGKAVSSTAPDMTEAQVRDFRYRLLGKFDPDIPAIADRIEDARRRLDALPGEGTRPTAKLPEPPTEKTVAPPDIMKPALPAPAPARPEEVTVEPPVLTAPPEPKEPPAYPEKKTVAPPKTSPIAVPEVDTRDIREKLLDRWASSEGPLNKWQVRLLLGGGIGALVKGMAGSLEGGEAGIAASVFGPAAVSKLVNTAKVRNWLTRPPANELEALMKVPYADRFKLVDGLEKVTAKAKSSGYKISPVLVATLAAAHAKQEGEDQDK